mmetsp:Transcript_7689/g.19741  ORF Transcript_7689/g.19741 Transcript_7689/m.19741 type:complete len:314 (+) Transcript_7689:814-1755(+)
MPHELPPVRPHGVGRVKRKAAGALEPVVCANALSQGHQALRCRSASAALGHLLCARRVIKVPHPGRCRCRQGALLLHQGGVFHRKGGLGQGLPRAVAAYVTRPRSHTGLWRPGSPHSSGCLWLRGGPGGHQGGGPCPPAGVHLPWLSRPSGPRAAGIQVLCEPVTVRRSGYHIGRSPRHGQVDRGRGPPRERLLPQLPQLPDIHLPRRVCGMREPGAHGSPLPSQPGGTHQPHLGSRHGKVPGQRRDQAVRVAAVCAVGPGGRPVLQRGGRDDQDDSKGHQARQPRRRAIQEGLVQGRAQAARRQCAKQSPDG